MQLQVRRRRAKVTEEMRECRTFGRLAASASHQMNEERENWTVVLRTESVQSLCSAEQRWTIT